MSKNIIILDPKNELVGRMAEHEWVPIHFSKEEYQKNEISFEIYEKLEKIL